MTNHSTNQSEINPQQERNAFLFTLVIFIGASISALYYTWLELSAEESTNFSSSNLSLGILALISLMAIWLVRTKRSKTAVTMVLVSIWITLGFIASNLSGLDLIFAAMVLAITFGTVSVTLPRKESLRAIYLSIIAALFFVYLYVVQPFEREALIENRVVWFITGAFIIGYLALILRKYRTYALRTKLILAFIVLSTVGVSIAFIFANFDMRQILLENAQSRLLAGATASASEIDTYLSYQVDTVGTTSTYLDLRAYLLIPPEQRGDSQINRQALNILYSVANRNPDAISYGLLDLDGMNIADSNSKNVGLSEADQDYFQLALNAKTTYISPVRYLSDDSKGVLFISAPINNDMGVITGILRAEYRATVLQDLLVGTKNIAGEGAFSVLFDSNHIVLAHGLNPDLRGKISFIASEGNIARLRENLLLPPNLPDNQLSLNIKSVEEGLSNFATTPYFSSEETALGFAISGAVTQLETVPWLVVAAQPEEIFLAPAQRQAQRALVAAITVILFAALSALGVANILVAPILQLQDTAQKFSEGDLNARATVNTDDEIGVLATTFNDLTSQLRGTVETLEVRIEERTKDLETRTSYLEGAAEISRAVGSIMDPVELSTQVVELIKERFGLYYVGLFLVDAKNEWAMLTAGTGKSGRNMLDREHKIAIGTGMIGWSIENAEARIALDVGDDAVRFQNPDLPETRSEGALPLRSRGRVLGALTIQSAEEAAFDETILTTLQAMTDQVAVALDNAELFVRAEEALISERKAYGQFSQKSWQEITESQSLPHFIIREDGTTSNVKDVEKTTIIEKTNILEDDGLTATIPIKNRDYVLGGIKIRKSEESGPWTKEQLEMTEAISEQLSVALESARLYDQSQRRATKERVIGDISSKLNETADIERLMQVAAGELRQILGASEVTLSIESDK